MNVTITGASGLVGGNLALELLRRGAEVRCLRRSESSTRHLAGAPIDWVEGDLDDTDALERAFRGADVVFHCAAIVSFEPDADAAMERTNVGGTRNVVEAMRRSGARRLVHCSSATAAAVSDDGTPVDETRAWNLDRHGVDDGYARSKRAAEEVVHQAVAAGLDAVIVQPGYLIGPHDAKPSTGKLLLDVVAGRMPGLLDGTNSFVDVRDVCRGMIAAAERGRRGEVYLLAGWNQTYGDLFRTVAKVAGVTAPTERVVLPGADVPRSLARWFHLQGFVFSSAKAERELGYRRSPLEPAIRDALDWFREHGRIVAEGRA